MESSVNFAVRNLSKTFGETRALDSVSFSLQRGRVHALLGGNGSGKSTLVKILAGVHQSDPGGEIVIAGEEISSLRTSPEWAAEKGLRFVHQDLGLVKQMTVAENLFVGRPYPRRFGAINWARLVSNAQNLLDAMGVEIDAKWNVERLGPSDRTLLAIARAVGFGANDLQRGFLILDEPTAKLAAPEIKKLLARLREYCDAGLTVIYVSHHLEELLAVADDVIVLKDGKFVGKFEMKDLSESDLVQLVVGAELISVEPTMLDDSKHLGEKVLKVDKLCGDQIKDVSFDVVCGEVVGLTGLDGAGSSETLKIVMGIESRHSGTVLIGDTELPANNVPAAFNAGVSYVSEDRIGQGAFLGMSVADNIVAGDLRKYSSHFIYRYRLERTEAKRAIEQYSVVASSVKSLLSTLSGGNQQKVVVARVLASRPRVAMLNEPTQGVDVGARSDIHRFIRAAARQGMALLISSSDVDELCEVADRVLVFSNGRVVGEARTSEVDRHWIENLAFGGEVNEY